MEPIVGMENPYHYRNKAQFPVGTDKEGKLITGFYAGRTHDIIANTDCALGVRRYWKAFCTIWRNIMCRLMMKRQEQGW